MYRQLFSNHIKNSNLKRSGKASSYIRAVDLVSEMVAHSPLGFDDCKALWTVTSIERLEQLYQFLIEQRKLGSLSLWVINGIAPSYLRDGFCSAAIRAYQEFLIEYSFEESQLSSFEAHKEDENKLPELLEKNFSYPDFIIEEKMKTEGKDVVRLVKTRLNQKVFQKMVFQIYESKCCITGLDIPEVNRASHIIPWAKRKDTRLDPRNGLCLSATYDAAFDRHLISLDDDYRIILSREIQDHYKSDIVKEFFHKREGEKISLPNRYKPHIDYLSYHRNQCSL